MKISCSTVLAFTGLTAAYADVITIGFDQLETDEDVLEYYNGGSGSKGSGPGVDLGVSFESGWIAGPPNAYPLQEGNSAKISGPAIVNFHRGWSGLTSFYYGGGPLTVNFYALEGGAGSPVFTLDLEQRDFAYAAGINLQMEVRSAVFTPFTGAVRIDALTNGALVVPEPAAFPLCFTGLCVLGVALRKHVNRLPQGTGPTRGTTKAARSGSTESM